MTDGLEGMWGDLTDTVGKLLADNQRLATLYDHRVAVGSKDEVRHEPKPRRNTAPSDKKRPATQDCDELSASLSRRHNVRVNFIPAVTFQICPPCKGPTLGRVYLLGDSIKATCNQHDKCEVFVNGGLRWLELMDECVQWLSGALANDPKNHGDHAAAIYAKYSQS